MPVAINRTASAVLGEIGGSVEVVVVVDRRSRGVEWRGGGVQAVDTNSKLDADSSRL